MTNMPKCWYQLEIYFSCKNKCKYCRKRQILYLNYMSIQWLWCLLLFPFMI